MFAIPAFDDQTNTLIFAQPQIFRGFEDAARIDGFCDFGHGCGFPQRRTHSGAETQSERGLSSSVARFGSPLTMRLCRRASSPDRAEANANAAVACDMDCDVTVSKDGCLPRTNHLVRAREQSRPRSKKGDEACDDHHASANRSNR